MTSTLKSPMFDSDAVEIMHLQVYLNIQACCCHKMPTHTTEVKTKTTHTFVLNSSITVRCTLCKTIQLNSYSHEMKYRSLISASLLEVRKVF